MIEEQQHRREARLCLNYTERFHKGHVCKSLSKVLCFETDQVDADSTTPMKLYDEQPQHDVMLHTIVSIATPRSIQVQGNVKDAHLQILIDSYSYLKCTHGRWVRQLEQPICTSSYQDSSELELAVSFLLEESKQQS